MPGCAAVPGDWKTGTVTTNDVKMAEVDKFLGMSSKYADDDTQGFYPNPQVTDTGVTGSATAISVASAAVAALDTILAIKIATKEYDIANSYFEIAEKKWDRFNQIYRPCETAEINEACNAPEYVIDYDGVAADVDNETTKDFGQLRSRMGQYFSLYCLCPDDSLTRDFALAQQVMVDDSINFMYRYEEWRKIAKDMTRWNRRAQALNRGRDLESEVITYAKAATKVYDDVSKEAGEAAEGSIQAFGYFTNRNSTVYPGAKNGNRGVVSQGQVQTSAAQIPPQQSPNKTPNSSGSTNLPKQFVSNNSDVLSGYKNKSTPYSHNDAQGSMVGSQTHSSTGA